MSVSVVGDFTSEVVWYDSQLADQTSIYSIIGLGNKDLASIKVYSKTGLLTAVATGSFLSGAGAVLSGFTTVDTDTGSTVNYSEIQAVIPAGTARISFSTNIPAFVSVEYLKLSIAPTINPTRYSTSGSITVNNSFSFALLGGGGSGGSRTDNSSHRGGGGGSGFLTTGTLAAGTYSFVPAAGAPASTTPSTGGTSNFSTFSAAGGNGGQPGSFNGAGGAGGNGGSGGGGGANVNSTSSFGIGGFNGNGGTGGTTPNGTGSGVSTGLFTSVAPSGVGSGGGAYAGGSGAGNAGGGSANGFGGGGGGAASSGAPGAGGAGGAGALWILEL